MKVILAEKCGFCPGVKNAISLAEKILKGRKHIYCLGPIIHNKDVVEKLAKQGLKTVDTVEQIERGTVLIRSHGAAPEQIARLKEKGLNIIDATCVLVKRLQQIATQLENQGYQVVVIGDQNHPEIQAVLGCAKQTIVVADQADLHRLPKNARLGIVCQTTQTPQHFSEMLAAIAIRDFKELKVINTLCKEAVKRQQSAVQLCKKVDIMFVLGGLQSANTKKLAELCIQYNPHTWHLQNAADLDRISISGKKIAGVTAGASTPDWIIAEFVEKLRSFDSK
jgi:4-hydroxy-3-methylbut-2-enyl diphosphate reductase